MERIRLSRSVVGPDELAAVERVLLKDSYLGMGNEVKQFESEIADYLNRVPNEVACVSSGTAALHLAVQAAANPGDEILVQSMTFVATYQAITAAGAIPISCEIHPTTLCIDLDDALTKLSNRCTAIMPVHYASYPAQLEQIYEFAQRHGLRVIEDAAHAFGSCSHQRRIGSFGDIVCFSFDGIKNITSGEGGAVVSSDQEVMSKVRDTRLLGVEHDTAKRYASERSWDFDVTRQGYRYHMSNLFAAIGRVQLTRLETDFGPKRKFLARLYRDLLYGIPGVRLLETDLEQVIPHIQPVRIEGNRRDELRDYLTSRGIETGIHYKPNHLLSLYKRSSSTLPVTEQAYGEILSLPLHPALERSDIERVCSEIRSWVSA